MTTGLLTPSQNSPDEVDRRKKVAEALMLQGTSAEPVKHWTQGMARVAQALSGSYMFGEADKDEKTGQAKAFAGLEAALSGMGGQAAPAPSMPPAAPAMGSPRPQMPAGPTGPIVSDKPLNGQGVIQGNLSDSDISFTPPGGGASVNMPRSPQVPQQAAVMPAAAGGLPPNTGGVLRALSDPYLGKFGQNLAGPIASKLLTPKDQWVPTQAPDGSPAQKNLATGEMKPYGDNKDLAVIQDMQQNPQKYGFKDTNDPNYQDAVRKRAMGQNISTVVNNVAEPVAKGVGEQFVEGRKAATNAANQTIPSIHEARKALDEGAVTGMFAGGKLNLARAGALFGMDPSQVINTEVFRSAAGNQVLAHAKELGANPSNTDRDFIRDVQGGRIELNEGTMRRLLDMQENWARQSIKRHNVNAEKLMKANPDAYRAVAPIMSVDEPGQYQKPPPATPVPDRNAIEQEMRRRNLLQQ